MFILEKRCDEKALSETALEKGLTPYEMDLLRFKYSKAYSWAQMEIKFAPYSKTTLWRYIRKAKEKLIRISRERIEASGG